MDPVKLKLRPKHDTRVRSGHPWVFSNQLADDVSTLPVGGVVDVHDAKGAFIGRGTSNPNSLISVRLLTRRKEDIDHPAFYAQRLRSALEHRRAVFGDRQSLRLVHAEGDGLPGLVIDRHGDVLAVQITTVGMEMRKVQLQQAVREVFGASAAVLRSEGRSRHLEGLPEERAVWFGDVPEHVDIDEYGVTFRVPLLGGQKTGHFYDQAWNRRFAGKLCAGRRVLDVYANGGGWALHALKNGATEAVAIDKSVEAAGMMQVNAELNGVKLDVIRGDGRKSLQELLHGGNTFGAVMIDPPAFAKSRKAAGSALRGYREVNALGLAMVQPGGLFFTSSCSHHVYDDRFLEVITKAAADAGRHLRAIRRGEQCADHPVDPAIPETRYLKSWAFSVEMAR